MNADDSTHCNGENVSAEWFPQYCARCSHQWNHFGALKREEVPCPNCLESATIPLFLEWWLRNEYTVEQGVTVEVPSYLLRGVEKLDELDGYGRDEILMRLVDFDVEFCEEGT